MGTSPSKALLSATFPSPPARSKMVKDVIQYPILTPHLPNPQFPIGGYAVTLSNSPTLGSTR